MTCPKCNGELTEAGTCIVAGIAAENIQRGATCVIDENGHISLYDRAKKLSSHKPTRQFSTGASRDTEQGKNDYEGCLSPLVLEAFGDYMRKHTTMADGSTRESDNWQKLFGEEHYSVCLKSAWRHFMDLWKEHRGYGSRDGLEAALAGILFNIMAYWHKLLIEKR